MKALKLVISITGLLLFMVAASGSATPKLYVGMDARIGPGQACPNSDTACMEFDTAAISMGEMKKFDFEVAPEGSYEKIELPPVAKITSSGSIPEVTSANDVSAGFNISAGGGRFLRFGSGARGEASLTVELARPICAFGAYITGIGDAKSRLTVSFDDGIPQSIDVIPSSFKGGVMFVGITTANPISNLTFLLEAKNAHKKLDVFGIDDVRYVFPENGIAGAVPEPSTLSLLGLGMTGAALRAVRRRKK